MNVPAQRPASRPVAGALRLLDHLQRRRQASAIRHTQLIELKERSQLLARRRRANTRQRFDELFSLRTLEVPAECV